MMKPWQIPLKEASGNEGKKEQKKRPKSKPKKRNPMCVTKEEH